MGNTLLGLRGLCLLSLCLGTFSFQRASAQTTTPVSIPILPKYVVLGVVYAPPGSSSFVQYGSSTSVGSQEAVTTGTSSTNAFTTNTSVGGGISAGDTLSPGYSSWSLTLQTNTSDGWTTSSSTGNTIDLQSSNGNTISTLGPISSSLGVNHDNDVVYILLNPVLTNKVTNSTSTSGILAALSGTYSNSCRLSDVTDNPTLYQVAYGCDPNQYPYPDIIGIPVWCLKNPYYPGQGCAQWIPYTSRSWDKSYKGPASASQLTVFPADPTNTPGLTLQDYADILKADPFVDQNGNDINVCHPTYGPNMDPNDPEVAPSAAVLAGAVITTLITSPGSYLTQPTTVTFSGGGQSLLMANVATPGAYSSAAPPIVTFTPPGTSIPGATTATGVANMVLIAGSTTTYQVGSISITNGGSGYTSFPAVTLTGGTIATGGSAATAVVPPVSAAISPAPTQATGSVNLLPSGQGVGSISILSGGSGYTSRPVVAFNGTPNTISGVSEPATAVAYISQTPSGCGFAANTLLSRFQPYGAVEYPVPGPNGLPSTYGGYFTHMNSTSSTTTSSDSHTTSVAVDLTSELKVGAGFFGIGGFFQASFGAGYSNSNTATWQNTNISNQSGTTTASYSITGPQLSDNYVGPATYNVYWDNLYGTYAFYSDLEKPVTLGTITIELTGSALPISVFSAPIGGSPNYQQITLVNNSLYPLTMVWPAVTFTDPGFQLVQNDQVHPDNCSNKYLLKYGSTVGAYTCTVWVEFLPQLSDAPNPYTGANYPSVHATMIAAGTENASAYQNILVTSQQEVIGTVNSATQGVTLLAVGNVPTLETLTTTYNPVPYIFPFHGVTPQTFIFTNNYTSSITLNNVTFSDSIDFAVDYSAAPDYCSGQTVLAGGTCTFTVIFQPQLSSPSAATGYFYTNISLTGTVATTPTVIAIASAAAAGVGPQGMSVIPAYPPVTNEIVLCTVSAIYHDECTPNNVSNTDSLGNMGMIIVTNLTYNPINLTIAYDISGIGLGFTTDCPAILGTPVLSYGTFCTITGNDLVPDGDGGAEATISISGTQGSTIYSFSVNVYAGSYISLPICTVTAQYCYSVMTFAPSTPSPSQTVSPGGTASYSFQISPTTGSYPAAVSFSATGLPAGATASFSPATIAVDGGSQTVVMSIHTAASAYNAQPAIMSRPISIFLGLLWLPLVAIRRVRRLKRKLPQLLCAILVLATGIAMTSGISGCASGKGSNATVATPQVYAITVTATSGSSSQSTSVILNIE